MFETITNLLNYNSKIVDNKGRGKSKKHSIHTKKIKSIINRKKTLKNKTNVQNANVKNANVKNANNKNINIKSNRSNLTIKRVVLRQ